MTTEQTLKLDLNQMRQALFGQTEAGHCVRCKQAFSDRNVFTSAGWEETHVSGMCEACFDFLFMEVD